MSLIDTTDGALMLAACNWAFVNPMRKLYCNLVITAVSVVVVVLIGGIEGLRLIGDQLGLEGWFWGGLGALNDDFSGLGFAIIGVFVFAWVTSLVIYRCMRIDGLDVRAMEVVPPEASKREGRRREVRPRMIGPTSTRYSR
jgi:high-affinity nickel-transport protein